MFNAHDFIVAG